MKDFPYRLVARRFDEFRRLEDEASRRRLWRESLDSLLPNRKIWGIYLLCSALVLPFAAFLLPILDGLGVPNAYGIRQLWMLLCSAGAGLVLSSILVAKNVQIFIRRRNLSLCDACGYNLTANTSGVCPECGRAIGTERKPEETASPSGQ